MTFTVWFEDNKDRIESVLRGDAEEALHQAYMAGMEHMGKFMADTLTPVKWNEDRRGDEFS
jgi:hypothetical protein